MPKIDISKLATDTFTGYPPPFDKAVQGRIRKRLGNAIGLDQFGVNLTTLKPGAASALRHWHAREDELVYVLEGEVVLVEDEGETVLRAGDCAGFKAGVQNGHHLVNRSGASARLLTVGTRDDGDHGEYSDIDMRFLPGRYSGRGGFTRKDGSPF